MDNNLFQQPGSLLSNRETAQLQNSFRKIKAHLTEVP